MNSTKNQQLLKRYKFIRNIIGEVCEGTKTTSPL